MKLYNQASRKVEKFQPRDPKNVKIYTCGPTVYNFQHIGNFAAYIYWDLLVRTLIANDYTPNRVLNITDVGHLVSDDDDGEDKLEKGARLENKTVWEVADFYLADFLENYRQLHLLEPTKITRATDYIEQGKALVDTLTAAGYTYETTDGVYFDTSKFPNYAKFAGLDLDNLKAGARVDFNVEKRHVSDFALWKFIQPGEKHAMRWDYLGRPGYPGWHLECSTIIHAELGETIDIHTGGIDHIPVHHTNEIAQSESAFKKPLAHFWLHCNFITIEGQKVSKSLNNFYTIQDLIKKGFSPLDYKMWVLQGHYQSERNFSFDDLSAAQQRRLNWRNRIALARQTKIADHPTIITEVIEQLSNNLNSAAAFALIDHAKISLQDWQQIDELFGLGLITGSPDLTTEQKRLLKTRATARENLDFTASDQLRFELESQGISVKDTPDGQIWQYLK